MNIKTRISSVTLALATTLALFSCKKNDGMPDNRTPGPDLVVYGITMNNELVTFNANMPGTFLSKTAIKGVPSGENVISIDFRPATGTLYALSDASKIYVINHATADAWTIGTEAFSPKVSGSFASIDFNPTVDRIRLVSNTGQNLRLHPETGAVVATDGMISGGENPSIGGVAYTNSWAGATSTVLFDIDVSKGKLYKQDPPNDGGLVEVGSLGVSVSGQVGFDISPDNNAALMTVQQGGSAMLYLLDPGSGKAALINSLAAPLRDIAIPTMPVAYAVDTDNKLHIFNPEKPTPVSKAINGLQDGEKIEGIDFRPVNGQLYALGSSSRIYTINLGSGAALPVGSSPFSPLLSGTDFGFDFNPTVDRIRLVSNTGQNLRLHPETGAVAATDELLKPGNPSVSGAAYTNNVAGATTTSLFVVDHQTDKLYLQNPPNDGVLVEVGSLGINIQAKNGMDIGGVWGKAYLAATVSGTTKIYTINTQTGAATEVSSLPVQVSGFAVGLGF